MSWIKCTIKLPGAGQHVKLKFEDGETTWQGCPLDELAQLKREYWNTLLWWDESWEEKLKFVEWKQKKDESDKRYNTIMSAIGGAITGAILYWLIKLLSNGK